jgi:hypothetical protein
MLQHFLCSTECAFLRMPRSEVMFVLPQWPQQLQLALDVQQTQAFMSGCKLRVALVDTLFDTLVAAKIM